MALRSRSDSQEKNKNVLSLMIGPPKLAAKLIALQGRLCHQPSVPEKGTRIEQIVSEVFVNRTMETIRSRFCDGRYQRTGAAAIFRAETTAQDAEFLKRVRIRHRGWRPVIDVVVMTAVEQYVVVVSAGPVHGYSVFLGEADTGAGLIDSAWN